MFSAEEKKVFIKTKDDKLLDAATGKPFTGTPPDDIDNVIVNNRLRNVINAALGALTLMSPDPRSASTPRRRCSSRATKARCPTLDKALAKEKDARVKNALEQARAAIVLSQKDAKPEAKIAAIEVIRERGDQDALGLLDGLPAGSRPRWCRRRPRPSRSIRHTLELWSTVQNAWYGLSLGSVLLLAAIGLAITFGVMGVINMAHGEMVMLGAYTTYVVQELIRDLRSRAVRLFAGDRAAARLPGGRRGRHVGRAQHHPLPLRPPAGNPARHLGPVADPAAGRAHRLSARPTRTSAIRPG